MQIAPILFLTATLGGSVAVGQSQNVPSPHSLPSAYGEARETYVNAALVQVQAYRRQIDAAVKAVPTERERYTESNRPLKELEIPIARLRSASRSEFDAIKANFERTRVALDRSLGRGD